MSELGTIVTLPDVFPNSGVGSGAGQVVMVGVVSLLDRTQAPSLVRCQSTLELTCTNHRKFKFNFTLIKY